MFQIPPFMLKREYLMVFLQIEIMNISEIVYSVSWITSIVTMYHSCILKNMKSVIKSAHGIVLSRSYD